MEVFSLFQTPMARKILRRTLKGIGYVLGGLSALLAVSLVATVVYIRSDAGERRLLDTLEPIINNALAPRGLGISVETLSGPLPSRLALRNIRLSDAHGIWFSTHEILLDVEWSALWGNTLRVNAIALDRPKLTRLPVLLPSESPPEQSKGTAPLDVSSWLNLSKIWPAWLPALALDSLHVDDLVLGQAVAGQRLVLTLKGEAHASPIEAEARLKIWDSMTTEVPSENTELASLSVTLTPKQTLDVRFALDNLFLPDLEAELGLIPGVKFDLQGDGPLTAWKASWHAELRDGGTATITSPGAPHNAPVMAALNGNIKWTLDKPSLLLTVNANTAQAAQSLWELAGQNDGQAKAQLRLMLTSEDTPQAAPGARTFANSNDNTAPPLNFTMESSVQLANMNWGSPTLSALFGPQLELSNQLNISRTAEGQTDLTLSQLRLQSGNLTIAGDATAKASLPLSDLNADISSHAHPESAHQKVPSSWLSTLLNSGDIAAKFSATLPHLAAFTPDSPASITTESPLTVNVTLSGPVQAPYAAVSFHTAAMLIPSSTVPQSSTTNLPNKSADSTALKIDEFKGQLEFPRIALVDLWPPLKAALPPVAAIFPQDLEATPQNFMVTGTFSVQASHVNRVKLTWQDAIPKADAVLAEAGDITIKGNLAAGWEQSGQLRLDFSQLLAQGAGVQVDGHVGGLLPVSHVMPPQSLAQNEAPPVAAVPPSLALQGELRAQISDWKKLSALAGYAIEGSDVGARIRLESIGGTQNLLAEWQATTLAILTSTPATSKAPVKTKGEAAALLSIKEWQGQAKLTGLEALFAPSSEIRPDFGKIVLEASNKSGRIVVSDALLAATTIAVSGPLGGPIHLQATVQDRREVRANQPPDPNRSTRRPRQPSGDTSDEPPSLEQELEKLTRRLARNITANLDAVWRPGVLDIGELRVGTTSRNNPVAVSLSAPASVRYGISTDMPQGGLFIKRMELAVAPAGKIVLEGTLNPQKWQFDANIHDLDLNLFRAMLTAMPSGQVQAQAALRGNMQHPAGELNIQLENFQIPGSLMPPASMHIIGKLENNTRGSQLSASLALPDKERAAFGVTEAVATLRLPLLIGSDGLPRPAPNLPLKGEVIWRGALAPLWNFLPVADKRLLGEINLEAQLSGSLQSPHLAAHASIRNAEYQDLAIGVLLKNIQATLQVQDAQRLPAVAKKPASTTGLVHVLASADDGLGGTLNLDGRIDLAAMSVSANGVMADLKPLRRQDLRINLSGDASVVGNLTHPSIDANIVVNEGELTLENLPGGNIRTLPISAAPAPSDTQSPLPPAPEFGGILHIMIQIPNRFFVRGHGLDSEWRGKFDVDGSVFAPSLAGTLSAVRGNLDFLGRNFKLSRGVVSFAGGTQINPMLDIIMTYQANSITADIGISGLATRPKLSLSSQPALPQDEILAQIMFGQSADKLGRLEALQLASAVASLANLSSGSGFGVLGTARKIFGVDVLRLNSAQSSSDNDDLGGAELEVGKYITDKVYVGVSQGISGEASTGVVVEIELTPRVNAEARAGTTRTEVGVEWKYDY